MSNAKRPSNGVIVLLITLFFLIVIGCGGSSGDGGSISGSGSGSGSGGTSASAGTTAGSGSGTLVYTLQWPVETRGIPSYALSVVVTVFTANTNVQVAKQTVTRNKATSFNQNISFNLPVGNYKVVAVAKLGANGTGDTVASNTINVTVVNGQTTTTVLDLNTTITKLFIDDLPAQGTVGDIIQLSAHAQDGTGNAILLPQATLDWTITAGGDKAIVTSDGQLTLLAPGTITIQVRDIDSDVTATKNLTLVQGSQNGVIIIVS